MKTIEVFYYSEIPENFTGIAKFSGGEKWWYKDGEFHREDGPAVEYSNGIEECYLEGKCYNEINLNDYIVLDYYKGIHNLMWYKLLGKDGIFEHPDIPGLITK